MAIMASGHRVPLLLQRVPSTKVYPMKPSIIIPSTPITNAFHNDSAILESDQLLSTHLSRASFTTLVPSPSPSPLPHVMLPKSFSSDPLKPIAAESIIGPDIMAIAELFSAMKHTLNQMNQTFEALGEQTEKMVTLSADIQAHEQIKQLHSELEQQIARQQSEIRHVKSVLEQKVKEALEHRLKAQAYEMIKDTISQQIESKVRFEMLSQIPSTLRQESKPRRPVLEIKTSFDANGPRPIPIPEPIQQAAPARPLLRPLPTPEQSPVPLKPLLRLLPTPEQSPICEPPPTALPLTSRYTSPMTAYPRVPAATPVSGIFPASFSRGMHILDTIPENSSSLELPRDLKSLFSTRRVKKPLFKDFSMLANDDSDSSSPTSDMSPLTPMPIVIPPPELTKAPFRDSYAQENPFGMFTMNDDEVPYLMIPPPKPRGN